MNFHIIDKGLGQGDILPGGIPIDIGGGQSIQPMNFASTPSTSSFDLSKTLSPLVSTLGQGIATGLSKMIGGKTPTSIAGTAKLPLPSQKNWLDENKNLLLIGGGALLLMVLLMGRRK